MSGMICENRIPELLAPAGSIEAMRAALKAGADAVYIGGSRFGARAYADNPDDAELMRAIDEVHLLNRRLYLTVNTLLKNQEIQEELCSWIAPFYRQGLDGVIVQDPGVIALFREYFPKLELHASTQMAITGVYGARLMKEAGICRVVPARELSLPEIRQIIEETGLEVECFIHGAMCYSYSGMCLMSSLIGGRSGNRGRCAGVCRLPFSVKQDRNGQRRSEAFPLNMKDLCALELIPELAGAGVASFKIEGRMKRPEYTAGVTAVYRQYLDLWREDPASWRVDPRDLKRLEALFNRDGLCRGYYHMHNGPEMIALQNHKQEDHAAREHSQAAQREYESIAKWLAGEKLQTACEGQMTVRIGEPSVLRARTADGSCAEAAGPAAELAAKQPTDAERIRKQLQKTGDSPFRFESLQIDLPEEPVFLPVGQLNVLRREVLSVLEAHVLQRYRRELPEPDAAAGEQMKSGRPAEEDRMSGTVHRFDGKLITDRDQHDRSGSEVRLWLQADQPDLAEVVLRTAQELPGFDERSFGYVLPYSDAFPKQLQEAAASGHPVRLALPYVLRHGEVERAKAVIRNYCKAVSGEDTGMQGARMISDQADSQPAAPGILVRNLEELGLLREMNLLQYAIPDAGLFAWNDPAVGFYRELGVRRGTVPQELNFRELCARDNRGSEMIVYGRAPMMVSAQCVRRTLGQCRKRQNTSAIPHRLTLTDRRGARFPVVTNCGSCYNIIYNSVPTSLLTRADELNTQAQIDSYRIVFTTEREQEVRDVLLAVHAAMTHDPQRAVLPFPTTGGHYRRGVR